MPATHQGAVRRSGRRLMPAVFALTLAAARLRPSDETIKAAIVGHLRQQVPASWSGSLLGGRNANVRSIEIVAVGRFNEQGKYWPVRAHVSGSCEVILMFGAQSREFDGTAEFKVYQDDYREWRADSERLQ